MDKLIHLIHSYLNFYKHSLSVCMCVRVREQHTTVCCCAISPPNAQVFRLGGSPPTPIHILWILK